MAADLNDTLIFVRVVQSGSFTAAARALQMPKTTVSRRVMALEAQLGAQLLLRTTRRLALTDAGAAYFEHSQHLARHLDDAQAAVEQLQHGPRGWLRVTLPYSFGTTWIAPLLAAFRAAYPEVRLEILASHVPLDLVAEEIDRRAAPGRAARFRPRRAPARQFPHRRLRQPRLSEAARRARSSRRPARPRHAGAPSGAAGARLRVALAAGRRPRAGLSDRSGDRGERPRAAATTRCAGEGLSLAMDRSLAADVAARRLRRVLPAWTGPAQDFHAVFPRRRVASPKVSAFVDFLRARLLPA